MTRDERQKDGVKKWILNKCRGTLEYATGVGKTRTALMAIKKFLDANPGKQVLVIVPTDYLKEQWIKALIDYGIFMGVEVQIINSAIKHNWDCGLLVIDEIHMMAADTFGEIFKCVRYKMILGLTATMKRLDGRHTYIIKYCPIVDTITMEEATANGWLAPHKEYKVLIDVDLTEYLEANKKFLNHFSFFNFDFNLAMACASGKDSWQKREEYLNQLMPIASNSKEKRSEMRKIITANAFGFIKSLTARKTFIYNHPKKVEIAELILKYRPNRKAITFSPTIKIAEKIKVGYTCHSKQTKKKRAATAEEFNQLKVGVLNTSKAMDVGADIDGLDLAIILSNTSSSTQKTQRKGRVVRFAENKEAEIFTLVLRGTVEEEWFKKSSEGTHYITIDEEELLKLLKGDPFSELVEKTLPVVMRY